MAVWIIGGALAMAAGIVIGVWFELWDWRRDNERGEMSDPNATLLLRILVHPIVSAGCASLAFWLLATRYAAWSPLAAGIGYLIAISFGAWRRYRRRQAVEYDL